MISAALINHDICHKSLTRIIGASLLKIIHAIASDG